MKKWVTYCILIMILITGCVSGFVPRTTLAGNMVNTSVQTRREVPAKLIDNQLANEDDATQVTPVVFLFMVDESGSVVGAPKADEGKKCPPSSRSDQGTHKENLATLFNILWDLPVEETSHLHLGINRFGAQNSSVTPLGPLSEISKIDTRDYLDESPSDTTTKYSDAFQKAASQLSDYLKGKPARKILFVLTDGFDVSKEREKVEDAISQIPLDTEIYIGLACPEQLRQNAPHDYKFWRAHRIPQTNFSIDFFQVFFDRAAFPKWGKTWGLINRQDLTFSIPGDIQKLQVFFEYFPDSRKDSLRFTPDDKFVYPSNSGPINRKPQPGCQSVNFKLLADEAIGFWRVESEPLTILPPRIILPGAKDIVNFLPLDLSIEIAPAPESQLARGDFAAWVDCYPDMGFEFSYYSTGFTKPELLRYPSASRLPCENQAGYLCSGEERLIQNWQWNLDTTKDLSQLQIYARPYVVIDQTRIYGDITPIDVMYKPRLLETKVNGIPMNGRKASNLDVSSFTFSTLFNQSDPTFTLMRPVGFKADTSCPTVTYSDGNFDYFQADMNPKSDKKFKLSEKKNIGTRNFKYTVSIADYILSAGGCGYSTLRVKWTGNGSLHELSSSWICDYLHDDAKTWTCQEIIP